MKKLFTFVTLIACMIPYVQAQYEQEPLHMDMIYKIKQEGIQNSQVMDHAFQLTDVAGPRLTGSPGLERASEWAVNQLTDWGLEHVELEKWGEFGRGWEIDKAYVAMTEPYYAHLIATPRAWSGSTDGLISGEVVYLDIEDEAGLAEYKGQLKDKIVLIDNRIREMQDDFEADAKRFTPEELDDMARQPMGRTSRYSPELYQRYMKLRRMNQVLGSFLEEEGAALIISGMRGKHGTYFTTSSRLFSNDDTALPELEMAPEHVGRMKRLIEEGIHVTIEAEVETQFFDEDKDAYNVIAEIPGTDPELKDEIVMLGAHLDSWHAGTGATDNAAGSSVMMEVVRILQAIDAKPRRTIRLALWTGEEQGIFGSRNYVKNHFADPETMETTPEYDKFSGYFNIDNGTGRIRGIYLQGNEAVRPIFERWFTPFADMIDHTTITIRNTGGTDHLGFDGVGLPGFQFIQDPVAYSTRTHHTNMDVYEMLIPEDLMQMSVIVASFVYHTAMRDEKLPREPMPAKETSGR